MLNLTRIENNDGLEFHVDENTQQVYCSISAAARMLGVNKSTVSRHVAELDSESAEIQTAEGLQGVAMLTSQDVFKPTTGDKTMTQTFDVLFKQYTNELAKLQPIHKTRVRVPPCVLLDSSLLNSLKESLYQACLPALISRPYLSFRFIFTEAQVEESKILLLELFETNVGLSYLDVWDQIYELGRQCKDPRLKTRIETLEEQRYTYT